MFVAKNSQLGGCFGSLGAEPPKAVGGPGAKPQPPEAGSLGTKPTAAGDLEAEPPTLENFAFFCKNTLILGLF